MNHEDRVFLRWVGLAVASGKAESLGRAASAFGFYCFKDADSAALTQPIPDEVWNALVGYLKDRRFQELDGSFKLVMLFQSEWARITNSQRQTLLEAIEVGYSQLRDRTSCLLLAQLLGEYYCSRRSFEILCRLQDTPDPVRRAYIAEGYGAFAKHTSDVHLGQNARNRLQAMSRDNDSIVAESARSMMRRLGARTSAS